jgi:2-oxo-3-hexenedioate decarboxylase
MGPSQTAVYAEELIRLADSASLAEPFSACDPGFSLDDAYRVSREVLRRREASGWRRIGRKIGFTNRTIYEQYQVFAPIFGYMYRETVLFASGTEQAYEANVSLQGLAQPQIEPEIFFALRSTPPRSGDPLALLSAIESYGHGFEIVQCHFPDWKFSAADTVADLGLHGRYVFGPRVAIQPGSERDLADRLATFRLTLQRDGAPIAEGGGELVLGSPLNGLALLVEVLASLPEHPPLTAGELITTGTLTAAMPIAPGQTWSTKMEGLDLPALTLRTT